MPRPASRKPSTLLGAYASNLGVVEACRALLNQPLKSTWLRGASDPHECDVGTFFDKNGLHETEFGIAHKQFHAALPYYGTDYATWEQAVLCFQRSLRDAIRKGVFPANGRSFSYRHVQCFVSPLGN